MQWADIGGHESLCVWVSVRRLQVAVLEITTPNFGFSTASTLGRSIFFGFGKKFQKRKKMSKKPLKNRVFLLKKTQFVTDFQYLWRFGDLGSLEKYFFYKNFKKSCLAFLEPFWIFLIYFKNGGWPRFFIFCFYRWNKFTTKVCACLDPSKSHFCPF